MSRNGQSLGPPPRPAAGWGTGNWAEWQRGLGGWCWLPAAGEDGPHCELGLGAIPAHCSVHWASSTYKRKKEKEAFPIHGSAFLTQELGLVLEILAHDQPHNPGPHFLICNYVTWNAGIPHRKFPLFQISTICLVKLIFINGQGGLCGYYL